LISGGEHQAANVIVQSLHPFLLLVQMTEIVGKVTRGFAWFILHDSLDPKNAAMATSKVFRRRKVDILMQEEPCFQESA
jgi:hypothetical protein